MRTAEICPNCATYINASCILYDGDYLSTLNVSELDSLEEILGNINNTFAALTGTTDPSTIPLFIGQLYINTSVSQLWIGMGISSVNWGLIGAITITTTTTSTSTSTSSTTTTTTTTP